MKVEYLPHPRSIKRNITSIANTKRRRILLACLTAMYLFKRVVVRIVRFLIATTEMTLRCFKKNKKKTSSVPRFNQKVLEHRSFLRHLYSLLVWLLRGCKWALFLYGLFSSFSLMLTNKAVFLSFSTSTATFTGRLTTQLIHCISTRLGFVYHSSVYFFTRYVQTAKL